MKKYFKSSYKRESALLFTLLIVFIVFLWQKGLLFSSPHLTFLAVVIALFGQRFHNWLDRPVIQIDFDRNSDRCFRSANPIGETIQDFPNLIPETRQYFRLKVINNGRGTAKSVRVLVDLYYEDMKEAERFEPNCLVWITGDKEIDIASGESAYINLLSQITKVINSPNNVPSNYFVIRWGLFDLTPRGIAWDIRSMIYNIKIIVHGDNIGAKTYWFKFVPDSSNIFVIGDLLKV